LVLVLFCQWLEKRWKRKFEMDGHVASALFDSLQRFIADNSKIRDAFGIRVNIRDHHQMVDYLPVLYWGDCSCSLWRSDAFDGRQHEISLLVVSLQGGLAGARALAAALIEQLHDADFHIAGHALVDLQFQSLKTSWEETKGRYESLLCFRGRTISD